MEEGIKGRDDTEKIKGEETKRERKENENTRNRERYGWENR